MSLSHTALRRPIRPRIRRPAVRQMQDRTERLDQRLDTAITALEVQLSRCNDKANLLLAFNGALLVFGGAPRAGRPGPVLALQALSAATVMTAISLLLLAVWARTRPSGRAAWPFWARLSPGQLRDCLLEDHRAEDVVTLSRLLRAKYFRINASIAFTLAGLALALGANWSKASL